jgi:hypothetical protein
VEKDGQMWKMKDILSKYGASGCASESISPNADASDQANFREKAESQRTGKKAGSTDTASTARRNRGAGEPRRA